MGLFANLFSVFPRERPAAMPMARADEDVLERELRASVDRMNSELDTALHAAAEATSVLNRLEAGLRRARVDAAHWHERAKAAVVAEDDAVARDAIAHRKSLETEAEELAPKAEAARKASERIRMRVAEMRTRIEEAARESATLLARRHAVRAQSRVGDAIAGSDDDAFAALGAYEAERRSAGSDAGSGFGSMPAAEIDAELEALRREVGPR
jgi:phage shock protein A